MGFAYMTILDHRPKQHFRSQCSVGWQETGKRKLDSSATDQISAEDLTSDDKQAKRRERFLTQEQKDAEAAKEEEAKKTQERISRFKSDDVKTDDVKPDDAKKADRSQRFQQWLGPNKTAPTAATANGKPKATGDKITAAVNSSLDQSAKLLGTGGKGKGASGKGASGKAASSKAPADVKFSDEFQAKADVSLLSCSYLLLFSICRTCDLLLHACEAFLYLPAQAHVACLITRVIMPFVPCAMCFTHCTTCLRQQALHHNIAHDRHALAPKSQM